MATPPLAEPEAVAERLRRRPTRSLRHYLRTLAEADPILRSVNDAIYVQDPTGRMLYANDAAARIFGVEDGRSFVRMPLEAITPLLDIFDEYGSRIDTHALMANCGSGLDWGKAQLFYSRTVATNESRWMLVRRAPVLDHQGSPEFIVSVATDATDGVRSKASARALADTTKVLSASLDYETTLANLTDALVPRLADWAAVICIEEGCARKLSIASVESGKARRIRDSWSKTGDDVALAAPVTAVLRSGEPRLYERITREELDAFATNDEEKRVTSQIEVGSLMIVPIVIGTIADGVIIMSNLASKRKYDRGDLELACEIGRRAGTAIEHSRLFRDAQNAVVLRNEFLAVAAHELRTPLAALSLQLQSLKRMAGAPETANGLARFRHRIEKTVRQSHRLTRLVDTLLDVSQVARGGLELHRSEGSLCWLVSDVCKRFADEAARAGSTLSFRGEGTSDGTWDLDRVDQVVANLLSNAIKYGRNAPIDVMCRGEARTVTVSVTDRGIGIAAENLARIFGRFERAVPTHHYGGLGLGLWIAQEIAEAHGGKIEAESTVGEGATFRLVLPRRAEITAT